MSESNAFSCQSTFFDGLKRTQLGIQFNWEAFHLSSADLYNEIRRLVPKVEEICSFWQFQIVRTIIVRLKLKALKCTLEDTKFDGDAGLLEIDAHLGDYLSTISVWERFTTVYSVVGSSFKEKPILASCKRILGIDAATGPTTFAVDASTRIACLEAYNTLLSMDVLHTTRLDYDDTADYGGLYKLEIKDNHVLLKTVPLSGDVPKTVAMHIFLNAHISKEGERYTDEYTFKDYRSFYSEFIKNYFINYQRKQKLEFLGEIDLDTMEEVTTEPTSVPSLEDSVNDVDASRLHLYNEVLKNASDAVTKDTKEITSIRGQFSKLEELLNKTLPVRLSNKFESKRVDIFEMPMEAKPASTLFTSIETAQATIKSENNTTVKTVDDLHTRDSIKLDVTGSVEKTRPTRGRETKSVDQDNRSEKKNLNEVETLRTELSRTYRQMDVFRFSVEKLLLSVDEFRKGRKRLSPSPDTGRGRRRDRSDTSSPSGDT